MIKREFVENNLVKILDYLPEKIEINNTDYYLYINKDSNKGYYIYYVNRNQDFKCISINKDFIQAIINIIKKLDTIIPDFINNLINI